MAVAREKLDQLYSAALEAAAALLEKNGEFFPILFELRPGGEITSVAVLDMRERPPSQDLIDNYVELMRGRATAGQIAGCAIALDSSFRVSAGDPKRDAVQVRVRAQGFARNVLVPYVLKTTGIFRKKRQLTLDEPRAEAAVNDVFGG
ncbi:hypothetical protein [Qipengyuania atrilutea]|uniref:Uncharacterized protein n=1 Tax=Qipengyuania atrilutea TaxID=2744473 RepID=A0A850HFG1_9SPHN|nr:hypothetical protein [Actirhodobacter atriluteus]NVD46099.1 hypothetical protein [Actirhodobacter atriluteus]